MAMKAMATMLMAMMEMAMTADSNDDG